MATLETLVSFNGTDGEYPTGSLLAAGGDLFGSTAGGTNDTGTVFEYSPGSGGGSLTTISSDSGASGSLLADSNGDLFGTTAGGGTSGDGTVFEIAVTATGYASTPTVLVSFNGLDGMEPQAGLITDASGDLLGTTQAGGGGYDNGTVFEIAKTETGYASTPTVLVSFGGGVPGTSIGTEPSGSLIADANGDLFGTINGTSPVFEVVKTATGYSSTPIALTGSNGSILPVGSLISDAAGDLFGATEQGGAGGGTIFEVAKTATGYASEATLLLSFDATDGDTPYSGLIIDADGNLFGTTSDGGGPSGDGVVFELAKTAAGYASTATVLASFDGTDGAHPDASLIADANGDLFGTTQHGGASGQGTIFEVTDSGFVVPCFCRGTRILTARGELPVEDLRVGDLAVTFLGRGEALKPVRWLGHRRIHLARHPRAETVNPVRIRAGALAEGRPHRDLLVSPGHRFPLDGALVAALDLVNGASIVQEAPEAVEYWHVELDAHDILLAEGAEAESYQDTGNRDGFEPAIVVSLRPHPATTLELDGAAPEPCLAYGTAGDSLRTRLRARAEALGWTLSEDPAPWLEAAGARIEPQRRSDRYRFPLPPGCTTAQLRSRAVRPRDIGLSDERRLGLQLHRLSLATPAGPRDVPLDHPALAAGFSRLEREEGWTWRWTDGDATLPLAALAAGQVVTAVEIAVEPGLRFWAAPAHAVEAAAPGNASSEPHAPAAARTA